MFTVFWAAVHTCMSAKRRSIESVAIVLATGAAASTAAGITALARGDTRGAPGMTKSLSKIGKSVGGGMLTGVAVAAGSGAIVGLALYRGINSFNK